MSANLQNAKSQFVLHLRMVVPVIIVALLLLSMPTNSYAARPPTATPPAPTATFTAAPVACNSPAIVLPK